MFRFFNPGKKTCMSFCLEEQSETHRCLCRILLEKRQKKKKHMTTTNCQFNASARKARHGTEILPFRMPRHAYERADEVISRREIDRSWCHFAVPRTRRHERDSFLFLGRPEDQKTSSGASSIFDRRKREEEKKPNMAQVELTFLIYGSE